LVGPVFGLPAGKLEGYPSPECAASSLLVAVTGDDSRAEGALRVVRGLLDLFEEDLGTVASLAALVPELERLREESPTASLLGIYLEQVANDHDRLVPYFQYIDNSGRHTHRVGEKAANPWGLYDVHGNAWEWCEDAWDLEAYRKRQGGEADPVNIEENAAHRVVRGGSWASPARGLRAACRVRGGPSVRGLVQGFRCVCLAGLEP